jgi:hypothetical protein
MDSFILLEDGVSFLLLEDGASKIIIDESTAVEESYSGMLLLGVG